MIMQSDRIHELILYVWLSIRINDLITSRKTTHIKVHLAKKNWQKLLGDVHRDIRTFVCTSKHTNVRENVFVKQLVKFVAPAN